MKKSITYNYSTEEIIKRAHTIATLVKEDLKKLENYGVSIKDIEQLEKKVVEFQKFPDDSFFAQKVKEQTQLKTEAEHSLIVHLRMFFLNFSKTVTSKKEAHKYFISQKLTGLKSHELIEVANKVISVYKKLKDRLKNHNVTEDYISELKQKLQVAKKAVKTLETVRRERIQNTTKRREIGSSLYEKISKLSRYGKTYWKDKDEDNYRKYLLYEKNKDDNE